jgi:hypothetical protein
MCPREQKLDVKITIKVTQADKENLDSDIPALAEQVFQQTGTEIDRSKFLRLVLQDLHKALEEGKSILWPPRLEAAPKKPRRKG